MQVKTMTRVGILVSLMLWATAGIAALNCADIQASLAGKAVGVLCFHSDDLRTNNPLTTPANNSITTFADGTTLPGVSVLGFPANFGSFTPVTDRGVISTGPTLSSGPVPGIQVEGWFAD